MNIIKGSDLRKLGFKKCKNVPVSELDRLEYHYFTYDIEDKSLLISCSDDEKVDGGYEIEFYDIPGLKFRGLKQLKKLVKLLKSAEIK
jgi:hypothetical protein